MSCAFRRVAVVVASFVIHALADGPPKIGAGYRAAVETLEREAEGIADGNARAIVLSNLGMARALIGDRERALSDLRKARELTERTPAGASRAGRLTGLGRAFQIAGDRAAAVEVLRLAARDVESGGNDRSGVVRRLDVAQSLAEVGERDAARKLFARAATIAASLPAGPPPPNERASALTQVVADELISGLVDDAIRTGDEVGLLRDDPMNVLRTIDLFGTLIKPTARRPFVEWVHRQASRAGASRADVLAWVVDQEAGLGEFDAALKTAEELGPLADGVPDREIRAFAAIAESLAMSGQVERARGILDGRVKPLLPPAKDGTPILPDTMLALARARARVGDVEGSAAMAEHIDAKRSQFLRARAMVAQARAQAAAGRTPAALATLNAARELAFKPSDDSPFGLDHLKLRETAGEIAVAQAECGDLDAALETQRSSSGSVGAGRAGLTDATALRAIADACLNRRDFAGAWKVAEVLPERFRLILSPRIAGRQAAAGDEAGALRVVESSSQPTEKAIILRSIAEAVAGDDPARKP